MAQPPISMVMSIYVHAAHLQLTNTRTHGPSLTNEHTYTRPISNEYCDGFQICFASHFGYFRTTGSCLVLTPNSCISFCSASARLTDRPSVLLAVRHNCTQYVVSTDCTLQTHFNNFPPELQLAVCLHIHKTAALPTVVYRHGQQSPALGEQHSYSTSENKMSLSYDCL